MIQGRFLFHLSFARPRLFWLPFTISSLNVVIISPAITRPIPKPGVFVSPSSVPFSGVVAGGGDDKNYGIGNCTVTDPNYRQADRPFHRNTNSLPLYGLRCNEKLVVVSPILNNTPSRNIPDSSGLLIAQVMVVPAVAEDTCDHRVVI